MEYIGGAKIDFSNYLEKLQQRSKPVKGAPRSERADLINQFMEGVNRDRVGEYKPVTFRQINGQLKDFTLSFLHSFLARCRSSHCFGMTFWSELKRRRYAAIA